MKTKLISMQWRGVASVDPRFSAAMLPWTIADIYSREQYTNLSIGVENGVLETYNVDFELQFAHQLKYIVGICKVATAQNSLNSKTKLTEYITFPNRRPQSTIIDEANAKAGMHGIIYLLKNPRDPLLHAFLFESPHLDQVNNLMHQMRDSPQPLGGSVGSIPSTFIGGGRASSSSGDLQTLQRALRAHGVHSTPASNLKFSESVRNAQHDGSPSIVSTRKIRQSKSYSHDLKSYVDNNSNLSNLNNNKSGSSSTSNSCTNLIMPDISPSNSQFFEVMYVGKIKVSHKRVPFTFIDDALPKFKAYDTQRLRVQMMKQAEANDEASMSETVNDGSAVRYRKNGTTSDTLSLPLDKPSLSQRNSTASIAEENEDHEENEQDEDDTGEKGSDNEKVISTKMEKVDNGLNKGLRRKSLAPIHHDDRNKPSTSSFRAEIRTNNDIDNNVHVDDDMDEMVPKPRDRSASIGSIPQIEQNRTMVLLVGKDDIRLISPDRKQVLLFKDMKDIASVSQGHKNSDHFGIIIRDQRSDATANGGHGYIGYVFKGQSDTVADDILTAIQQSFISHSESKRNRNKNQVFSCEHCPMLWYHKLCTDVEGLNDKKTQTLIFRRIEQLPEEEQEVIMAKYYGAEQIADHSLSEQNQFLMMLLRAHSESRQQRHVHDTAENRTEFLNQYLGGSTIFMKAKRSLTGTFDHLLKRKNSKDDVAIAQKENKIKDGKISSNNSEHSFKKSDEETDVIISRPRNASIDLSGGLKNIREEPKSPMMDIFMKVGNSPKEGSSNAGSWRQEILQRVVTPSKNGNEADALLSPLRVRNRLRTKQQKRTQEDYRELWKTAIHQTILLNRMEKENERFEARKDEHERKRMKLDYDEIVAVDKQTIEHWGVLIGDENSAAGVVAHKCDPNVMLHAIRGGVPRSVRGDVWKFLAAQYALSGAPIDTNKLPNYNTPYQVLLKSLTEHQHSIFIDLSRTFPKHPYYKDSLGVGQLALFNVLKAYSILDPELGYCQGLGFICGILLLHCEEEEAFELLKHLMFIRKMRANYLPDMKQFQLQLYQLSRLIRDRMPELYRWLDTNEVSPTLYAAPWILTIFSSQFPLGFVTRVFDLLFLESSEVVFRVAIKLLDIHQDELMKRDNFEDIMNYMKTVIPNIDATTMDKIIKDVFVMDIKKQLAEYQVEYNVLQEEISTSQHYMESLNREKENYSHLESKLQFAESSIAQLEKTRSSQQSQIQSLHMHVQSLETTVETLGQFMLQLTQNDNDLDMPDDVRRIIQQIGNLDAQRKRPIFMERKIGKSMSMNASLGFPLKVLEELENNDNGNKSKSAFFENTYIQLRKQSIRSRPNHIEPRSDTIRDEILPLKIDEQIQSNDETSNNNENNNNIPAVNDFVRTNRNNDGLDSGIATPLSPKENSITNIVESIPSGKSSIIIINDHELSPELPHPFGNCEDVNFKYSGTTQLKSLRPIHLRTATPATGTGKLIDRS